MSRARPFHGLWFDQKNPKATAAQLELLAAAENVSLDDLLDEGLTQKQVLQRLREALHGNLIPAEVLERRRLAKIEAGKDPVCRICDEYDWTCEGSITRHHFIPRWMMLMLDNYQSYAARAKCTIPICVGRHRDLHYRSDRETPKSIVGLLTDQERAFGAKMLDEFKEQHPKVYDLIAGGTEDSYEYILIRDHMLGRFHEAESHAEAAGSDSEVEIGTSFG
jgi:hypothetical protein